MARPSCWSGDRRLPRGVAESGRRVTLADVLRASAGELERLRTSFALIGGLAVSARTEPRFTRDIDLAVAVTDDDDAERRVHGLVTAGFSIDSTVEQTARGRLATVRLRPPGEAGGVLDLLFASSGIEPEIVTRAEPLEILSGLTVPVARTGDLIALKLLARDDDERPQDALDIRALARAADDEDWALARTACQQISDRGFNRGRDLLSALDALIRS